jgi:hypothetical protein
MVVRLGRFILIAVVLLVSRFALAQDTSAPTPAPAQPAAVAEAPAEPSLAASTGIIKSDSNETSGFGGSTVSNLFAARLDGTFDAFSAGIGGGVSYKWLTPKKRYHYELGLYLAPQITKIENADARATVAVLLHAVLYKSFGIGFGYHFWQSGVGLVEPDKPTLFFTAGIGLTNKTDR